MLHANYWVVKEKGPSAFIDNLRHLPETPSWGILSHVREEAFSEACTAQSVEAVSLWDTFARYRDRRQMQFQTEEGILQPEDVANLLLDILRHEATNPPGVYVVTAPYGKIWVERLPLSVACPRV